jgi:hypothetical protein
VRGLAADAGAADPDQLSRSLTLLLDGGLATGSVDGLPDAPVAPKRQRASSWTRLSEIDLTEVDICHPISQFAAISKPSTGPDSQFPPTGLQQPSIKVLPGGDEPPGRPAVTLLAPAISGLIEASHRSRYLLKSRRI